MLNECLAGGAWARRQTRGEGVEREVGSEEVAAEARHRLSRQERVPAEWALDKTQRGRKSGRTEKKLRSGVARGERAEGSTQRASSARQLKCERAARHLMLRTRKNKDRQETVDPDQDQMTSNALLRPPCKCHRTEAKRASDSNKRQKTYPGNQKPQKKEGRRLASEAALRGWSCGRQLSLFESARDVRMSVRQIWDIGTVGE